MSHKGWPEVDQLVNVLTDSLGSNELFFEYNKLGPDKVFSQAIEKLIINNNEALFDKLLQNLIEKWRLAIISNSPAKFSFVAQSFNYKSPGFGKWFRCTDISIKDIFESDKILFELFRDKYSLIPQGLNISLDNKATDGIFLDRIYLRTKEGDGPISYDEESKSITLPVETIICVNNFLKRTPIEDLICYGRNLITYDKDYKPKDFEKTIEAEIKKYFDPKGEFANLNIVRLLLSAYIVFRSAKSIEGHFYKSTTNTTDLLIIVNPLRGPVSNQEKEGSWLLFYTIPCTTDNKDLLSDDAILKLEDLLVNNWWSLVRGADLNASIKVNHQYWSLSVEKLITEMVNLDSKMLQNENDTAKWIISAIGGEKEKPIKDQKWPQKVIDNLKKIVGQNENFIEFLRRLKGTAELGVPKIKDKKQSAEVISIFLYSEPGTGKETLAYLVHLWSRGIFSNNKKQIEAKKLLWQNFFDANIGSNEEHIIKKMGTKTNPHNPYAKPTDAKKITEHEVKDAFFSINCALLDRDNFSKLLFGTLDNPNGMLDAAFYSGTCFFDEFNTIQKGLENHLLKLLVEPNEALVNKCNTEDSDQFLIKQFNCVFVFASNKTPDELIAEGYNPAVISRVSQYYFEVPPLRNRKEDMLLSLVSQLDKLKDGVDWDKIDPIALRFLCMLPWEGNYRALQGFVNDLFNDRKLRGIKNPTITFQEIVECAVRRKLIG